MDEVEIKKRKELTEQVIQPFVETLPVNLLSVRVFRGLFTTVQVFVDESEFEATLLNRDRTVQHKGNPVFLRVYVNHRGLELRTKEEYLLHRKVVA